MPSLGEIFTVMGAAVGTGVTVGAGVNVNEISVGVEVAVDGEGVGRSWHAASKKIERRSRIIFFIGYQ